MHIAIDLRKTHLKVRKRPINHWDYVEFEGFWWPRLSPRKESEARFLKTVSEEEGRTFRSTDQYYAYMMDVTSSFPVADRAIEQ